MKTNQRARLTSIAAITTLLTANPLLATGDGAELHATSNEVPVGSSLQIRENEHKISLSSEVAKRYLTEEDEKAWSRLADVPVLSPDGKWLIYIWSGYHRVNDKPRNGPPELILKRVDTGEEQRRNLGEIPEGQAKLKMSTSGRWIAFTQARTQADRADVMLMDLKGGLVTKELGEGQDFQFSADERWIAVQGYAQPPQGYELRVHEVRGTAPALSWFGVKEYAFEGQGRAVAFINAEGLQVLKYGEKQAQLLGQGEGYRAVRWSPKGRMLATLRAVAPDAPHSLIVYEGMQSSHPQERVFDPSQWDGFPADQEIATKAVFGFLTPLGYEILRWRDEEDGIYFETQKTSRKLAPSEIVPDLILWHWKDLWVPTQKRNGDTERYMGYVSLPEGRFVRLADEEYSNVLPQGRGKYALAYNWRKYEWLNFAPSATWKFQKRDYVLVDLRTGVRRPLALMTGLDVVNQSFVPSVSGVITPGYELSPQLSPSGSTLIYLDNNGHCHGYDVVRGADHNATADNPQWVMRRPGDIRLPMYPQMLQGWSADGRYALVMDGYDVWAVPLRSGQAFSLTGNGRRDGRLYDAVNFSKRSASHTLGALSSYADGAPIIDLGQPVYFSVSELRTGRTGLAAHRPGAPEAQVLFWEEAALSYFKASDAPVYIAARAKSDQGLNYYRVDQRWRPAEILSDLYPQIARFKWPAAPQWINFQNREGALERALLLTPAGATPGHPLPTIVTIYERLSIDLGSLFYDPLVYRGVWHWLRHGYAVLIPSIVPKSEDAGPNALRTVTGAVEAAAATGWVDRERVGLRGHSYGGYETFFIVTKTDLFKAAVPTAGVTDLRSFYNSIAAAGSPQASMGGNHPVYVGQPWWKAPEVYKRNSPMENIQGVKTPLLIIHGDADDSVPFEQSLQFFNALRVLGGREAVLLQYVGGNHGSVAYDPDPVQRELEFFNHFLRDSPAPSWWQDGTSYYKGSVPTAHETSEVVP